MNQREIDHLASAVRKDPIEPVTIACPPVVYDLPSNPLLAVIAALRGDRAFRFDLWCMAACLAFAVVTFLAIYLKTGSL